MVVEGQEGPQSLVCQDVEQPQPGPGQVLVRMYAHALNYRDLVILAGGYPHNDTRPVRPVSDGAGEVVAVGAGVDGVQPGDRVMAHLSPHWLAGELTTAAYARLLGGGMDGTLAEYCVFEAHGVVSIPAHLRYEEAATLPCAALTAWEALIRRGQLAPGQTVLLLGTGGVSLFGLQFAKMAGAGVIITSKSNEKLQKARALGADGCVNYAETPDWDVEVRTLTHGRGVDHVLETGGGGTLEKSIRACAFNGQISLVGVLTGLAATASPLGAILSALRLQGIYVASRAAFEAMNRAIEHRQLRPVIDRVFPFEEAAAAYEYFASAQHFGKVVISHQ